MAPPLSVRKRKIQDAMNGKITRPKKKFKKQLEYHSSSEEEGDETGDFAPVNLQDSEDETKGKNAGDKVKKADRKKTKPTKEKKDESDESDLGSSRDEDDSDDSGSDADSDASSDSDNESNVSKTPSTQRKVPKRNDPSAFSTSISKILSTKLPTSARADPVLSRSKVAAQTTSDLANEKLEQRARAKLRAEKKEDLDRGRITDVLGVERGQAGQTAEEEKRLRKIAQRGVVKLFNAVRAAQVRGEEAAKAERKKGTIGIDEREKAVNEVSKQGFLELINGKKGNLNIEEA